MACPKWSLFVAGFSILSFLISFLFALWFALDLYMLPHGISDAANKEDPDNEFWDDIIFLNGFNRFLVCYIIFALVDFCACIASIFLWVGLKKKYYQYVLAWLIVTMIVIFVEHLCLYIISGSKVETGSILVLTLSITVFWYPIYKEYKRLRFPEQSASSGSPMARICHQTTEYVHHTKQPATAPIDVGV